ncbi:MAG: FAD-dependent oxidoreductase [Verrucomicrobiota bacterium]
MTQPYFSILAMMSLAFTASVNSSPADTTPEKKLFYYRPTQAGKTETIECDVAIYGGTPAGVTAGIQAAKLGKKVVLITHNQHVGGMTSGGLTATDVGKEGSIGGLALEFYERLGKMVDYSPSEAEALYRKMLDEAGVQVIFGSFLKSVEMLDNRIGSITLETGKTCKATVFIDSTYEGDLLAAANVSYRVGREPVAAYGETLNGQWQDVSWHTVYQFCGLPVSPYVTPDDPKSGLLPEISADPYGKPGEGDYRVQAYNFRMRLSNKEGNIPFPKPKDYDAGRYALLARFMNASPDIKWTLNYTVLPMTDGPVQMRNGDSNNAGSMSSNLVNGSYRWPDGTFEPMSFEKLPPPRRGLIMPFGELYQLRETLFQEHLTYQQGYMYFLANDPQVPEGLRKRVNAFGLCPDEFKETAHWPHHLYIREGRRMVSDYVMTQNDCEAKTSAPDSVGLGSYNMDSHPCQRTVVNIDGKNVVRNEGAFGHKCNKPYPISYRSIVPKKSECMNLLVPVCLSSTHVAYGSIRMEPVFMILGQSAGIAASMAIENKISVQDVDYEKFKLKLLEVGQRLEAN